MNSVDRPRSFKFLMFQTQWTSAIASLVFEMGLTLAKNSGGQREMLTI